MEIVSNLLMDLVNLPCISGYEHLSKLPDFLYRYFKKNNCSVEIDDLKNVIVRFGNNGKKILFDAHLDEVGFFKTNTGYTKIGSIKDEDINLNDIDKTVNENVGFFKRLAFLKENLFSSPALDNRVGCLSLILLANFLRENNFSDSQIFISFTSRHETTGEGIISVVNKIKPDIIFCIDSAYAKPFEKNGWEIPVCGKGPSIQIQGEGFFIKDYKLIEKIAKEANIPYQFEIVDSDSGGTNLTYINYFNSEKFQINIPVRYQHTSRSEVVLSDIENTSKLLMNIVKNF